MDVLLAISITAALAEPPVQRRELDHAGARWVVVTIDRTRAELELHGQGARSDVRSIADARAKLGDDLLAATNAGLFHTTEVPVGLHADPDGVHRPLDTGTGWGNFYLAPNGVFSIDAGGASVAATEVWQPRPGLRLATQSGPALLLDGAVHPALDLESEHLALRSGVCVEGGWTVHLAISAGAVRFHDLATLFRDALGCTDGLYLDGKISELWTPGAEVPDRDFAGVLTVRARPAVARDLREGDVVFQRSPSSQAPLIARATGSPWTHTGVVLLVDGAPHVLEASTRVQITPWAEWAARAVDGQLAVRRRADADTLLTEPVLVQMHALAEAWEGRPYDARFGWGDEAMYCSELVHKLYERATGLAPVGLRRLDAYDLDDSTLVAAIEARWGGIPGSLAVVAPSDLYTAPGWVTVE